MGSFRRNSTWQLLQSVSSTGTDLLVLLAFSARLDAAEFGQLTISLSIAKIIFMLCEPRIHEYLIPRLVRAAPRTRRGVWVWTRIGMAVELGGNLGALLVCTLVYLFLPAILRAQAGDVRLFPFAVLFVLTSTLLKFSSIAVFRALGDVKTSALLALGAGAVKLAVLGGTLFGSGRDAEVALCLLSVVGLAAALLQAATALAALRKRFGARPRRRAGHLRIGNLYRAARQIFGNYAMGVLEIAHRELDMQILAALTDSVEAGRYRVAKNLSMILLEVLNPVVLMLLPEFSSRVARGNWRAVADFTMKAAISLAAISMIVAVPMYLIIPMLVERLLPAQIESIPVFKIMLAGLVMSSPLIWSQSLLVATNNSYGYVLASAIGAAVAALSALALVPRLGAIGSAVSYALSLLVISSLAAIWSILIIRKCLTLSKMEAGER